VRRFRPTWQKIKHMPPELIPLAVVMALGLGGTVPVIPIEAIVVEEGMLIVAAGFSMTYKLMTDPSVSPPLPVLPA
jgi:hypothetical protein